ncbi:MAG: peptidylprolyl isomerase [Phycisphaerales bacterium]|nr:peptidylprolyl isomerase [Phycisphaerales bacterium]
MILLLHVAGLLQAGEGGDLGWRKASQLPTMFTDVVATMNEGDVSTLIASPSGFHIIKLDGVRSSEQHVVDQTKVQHILIKPNELVSGKDARIRLEQLKLRIEGGDSFGDLARSHSDDRGSAVSGGDLGWVSPGDLVPEFEDVMNQLAPGDISEPFESRFGWHIVRVVDRRRKDDTEEVRRARARDVIRQRKIEEEYEAWLRKLRDEAYVEYRLPE